MPVKFYVLLVISLAIVPLCCDLFLGRKRLKEILRHKRERIVLIFLSLFFVELVWLVLRIYLMVYQLPLESKW